MVVSHVTFNAEQSKPRCVVVNPGFGMGSLPFDFTT